MVVKCKQDVLKISKIGVRGGGNLGLQLLSWILGVLLFSYVLLFWPGKQLAY